MGDDLVWRGSQGWVACKGASQDPVIRKSSLEPEALRALLAHTYRVLLTRGMKGTYVYSTDPQTQLLLKNLVA